MLADAFIREDFQRLMANTLPPVSRWDRRTLHILIQSMLDYFERKYQHQPRVPPTAAPLIERAIHAELTKLLLSWLKQSAKKETQWRVPMETIARIVGWAIFGSVIQWSQEETATSSEQMTNDVLLVIIEGVARLAPDALPE